MTYALTAARSSSCRIHVGNYISGAYLPFALPATR